MGVLKGEECVADVGGNNRDQWAKNGSVNKRVKVLVGLPGSTTAAGRGYVDGEQLKGVLQYSRGFESFGGVMVW
jgi:chitinase